jgi:hypothetical protein
VGIESDQLVFDYLSRVGDLAQQRQLPSGTRMRLVSELRGEIDRRRAKATLDSPAAVRRILDRIGTPESVVAAAGTGPGTGTGANAGTGDAREAASARAAVPVQRGRRFKKPGQAEEPEEPGKPRESEGSGGSEALLGRMRRMVPRQRPAGSEAAGQTGAVPTPPHLASTEELGSGVQPDWWRVESGPFGATDSVPGFTGGVEIPEIFKPPPGKGDPDALGKDDRSNKPAEAGDKPVAAVAEPVVPPVGAGGRRRRLVPRLGGLGVRWANPVLLLAAALLVAGAVIGNLVMLALGWLIAYLSRRLSPSESKWAVLFVPGLVVSAGVVWLWGRREGRWGEPLAEGAMGDAVAETWPVVLRAAAVASAVFLVWRSQRKG